MHLDQSPERVTVRFEPADDGTRVIVLHERIADAITRNSHEVGWQGCLDRLQRYLACAPTGVAASARSTAAFPFLLDVRRNERRQCHFVVACIALQVRPD